MKRKYYKYSKDYMKYLTFNHNSEVENIQPHNVKQYLYRGYYGVWSKEYIHAPRKRLNRLIDYFYAKIGLYEDY